MTSKSFYKSILLKITPISLFILFLFGGINLIFDENMNSKVMVNYICVSISVIIIIEILMSFFLTLIVLKRNEVRDKSRAKLYLLLISYLPSFIANLLLCLYVVIKKELSSKYLIVYTIALTSMINYLVSIILNLRIKAVEIIFEENKEI